LTSVTTEEQQTMKADQLQPRSGYQRSKPLHELWRRDHPARGAVAPGPLQLDHNLSGSVALRRPDANPFALNLATYASCNAAAGGMGILTCDGARNLGSAPHAGNLALFQAHGSPMATAGFASASGYDRRLPAADQRRAEAGDGAAVGWGMLTAAADRERA
jgi:hypothetical protein